MNRSEIINKLKAYFNIKELVCDHIYSRFGEGAWDYLDTALLATLLVLRTEIINKPLICNTSAKKQRGMRCNMCDLVKSKTKSYLSAHVLGKGVDLSCNGYSAEEMRKIIANNANKLPYNIRLEKDVDWLHVDTNNHTNSKIVYFKG